jgi:hypothetical protein
MIAGSLEIQLYADIARLRKDMDDARRVVGDTMGSISGAVDLAKKALGALGVAMSANAFANMIKGSIDAAAGLHDMSIQTGASVASLMAFRSVAATTDTTITDIAGAMNKFAKGMAVANEDSKGIGQAVQSIGLDFDKLKSMSPDQQMLTIAKALDHFRDGAGKSAVAMTFFGREGAKMLPFLKDLADESDAVTAKLTEQQVKAKAAQAAMADDFSDNLTKIKKASEQWKKDLAMGMLPALTDASEAFLKAAGSANGLNAAVKRLSEDGSIERWTRGVIDGITKLTGAVAPAAKVWAAYYASFVLAPTVFAAVATAIGTLQVQLALARMEMASGATVATLFGTSLGGVSVSAEMAAGSLGVLKVAARTLFAAFAGWEIGTYLRDSFVEVRIAGLAFVGALLTGWENVKYGAEMAWEGIKFAWDKTVGAMKASFADYLGSVAKGLSFVGAGDTAKQVEAYADGLRKAAGSQQTFEQRTAGVTAAHKAALATIDQNIVELVGYELATDAAAKGVSGLAAAAKGAKKDLAFDANADTEIKKEAQAYATLIAAIRSKTDENRLELEVGQQATESEKARIKVDQELASGKLKLTAAHLAAVRTALDEQAATEKLLKAQEAQRDITKFIVASTQARNDAAAALGVEYSMYGKSADAREIALVAVKAEADMQKKIDDLREKNMPISEQIIAQLNAERDARILVEQATMGQGKALQYAAQLADENKKFAAESIPDPRAREKALLNIDADVWRERIRIAGEGTEAQKILQKEYDTWYANRLKGVTANVDLTQATALLDIMSALDEATRSAAQGMTDSFGRVGSAIGGLTTALSGYGKAQAAIAAQLAATTKDAHGDPAKIAQANMMAAQASAQAQIKSYGDMAGAAKGFFKESTTGYKVMEGAEKTFRAYEMAMAVDNMVVKSGLISGYTGLFVASKATQTAVETGATAASVANAGTQASAWGVTAVVKAIASLPFPLNLAAGAVTLAAVAALGVAMVGGIGGGATAVNPNSAEERQKVQGTGTVLGDPTAKSASMAHSLEIMQKNSDLELGYQNSMLTALQNIASALGGAAKGISQTAGITGGSAFGTVASSDNSFIGASHTKDITDSGVQFSGTFGQLRSGGGVGRQYEDVYTTSDGGMFRSGWTRTDTNYKALSAEAMKPFALIFDNMGNLLVDAGAKLGKDSMSLTSAINNISVDFGVSLRGLTGQDLTDALNAGISVAFDKVTTQIFPSIQQFQKMGEGLGETLVRVASDVQGVDSVFASMGKSTKTLSTMFVPGINQLLMQRTEMSLEAKERLVEAAGGLDKFASSAKSFMQNFYSEAEQRDATKAKLSPVLAQYGLSTEGANAQAMFKNFVLGLDASTAAGAKTYATLMDLQQAFFDVTDAAASQRKDLQDQLDQLTMSPAQLLAKQRNALDASNRALFDQVQAAQKAKDAQDAAKSSLSDLIGKMASFRDSTRSLHDSLLVGSLSPLAPEEQYAELRRQYEQTKAAALGGDAAAQSGYASALNALLTFSQKINSGDSQYQADFAMGQKDAEAMAAWAAGQVDVNQAQLDVLNSQNAALDTANATLLAIAQNTSPIDPASYGGADSMPVLVAQVKEMTATIVDLKTELAGLRADQQKQTGDGITGNAQSQQDAANTIVSGIGGAIGRAVSGIQKVALE